MRVGDVKVRMRVTVTNSYIRKYYYVFEKYPKTGTIMAVNYETGFCLVFLDDESDPTGSFFSMWVPSRKLRPLG